MPTSAKLNFPSVHRVIYWTIVIVGVLCVPYTHGVLEYFGLILAGILLVFINFAIARKRGIALGGDGSPRGAAHP